MGHAWDGSREGDIGNIVLKEGIIDQQMEPVMIIAQP
jgi:hypothetical protein